MKLVHMVILIIVHKQSQEFFKTDCSSLVAHILKQLNTCHNNLSSLYFKFCNNYNNVFFILELL